MMEEIIKLIHAEKKILEKFKEAVLDIPIAEYTQEGYRYRVLATLLSLYDDDLKDKKNEQEK